MAARERVRQREGERERLRGKPGDDKESEGKYFIIHTRHNKPGTLG